MRVAIFFRHLGITMRHPKPAGKTDPQIKGCYDSPHIYFGNIMLRPMQARLTQPLVRENGSHRPATWDEAMDRVAAAFSKSIEKNDPRNFGMFSCSKTTNELNYAAQKFVRSVMGTNNIDSCNRT